MGLANIPVGFDEAQRTEHDAAVPESDAPSSCSPFGKCHGVWCFDDILLGRETAWLKVFGRTFFVQSGIGRMSVVDDAGRLISILGGHVG